MPRIDPQQLLKCLSVLLSPKGGIKSKDEVQRLASLMTKFSKKLVSKCIYVSILKATETDLLVMFMSEGGWDLTFTWLSDGVFARNWPLVKELVELLLVCPVDIDRLKTNACPKLIKTLSKDTNTDENVRLLACKLVEQWLRVVRGDSDPSQQTSAAAVATSTATPRQSEAEDNSAVQQDNSSEGSLPVYKITIRDGEKMLLAKVSGGRSSTEVADERGSSPTSLEDVNQDEEEPADVSINDDDDDDEDYEEIKPVKLKKKPPVKKASKQAPKKPAKVSGAVKKERDSTDSSSSGNSKSSKQKGIAKLGGKKEKVESPKIKPNLKNKNSSSPRPSDNAEKNVGTSKKSDESLSNLKQKAKLSLSLKNKKLPPSSRDKKEIKSEKNDLKDKMVLDEDDSLTEKEKESLKKLIAPPISKLGKIPKKTSSHKEEKQSEEKNRTLKEDTNDSKVDIKKSYDMKKPEVKRPEKNFSIGVDRKSEAKGEKPKTVKTYNSKFRSTGLEEEVKPPPPRPIPKKPPPPLFPGSLGLPEKKFGKRMSPPPESNLPEKKAKPDSPQEEKKSTEKAGGIKLIPPKPKPMFLQESDVFMDAMLAANTMKEPRKRKRKPSVSKEGPSDPKKDAQDHKGSPSNSPKSEDSPSAIKPTFKFYQDTLETSMEEEKGDRADDENLEFAEPDKNDDDLGDDQKSVSSTEEEKVNVRVGQNGPLKGVLVHLKSRRQKKSVTWREDALETIKYFELDETERVNVTKNFSDMKLMEREHERENFQLVRKLAVDDVMEEKTRWRALIPIDIAATIVAPGKNSQEKEIQYAREKTVPAAIYFNKRMIPDAPAEPDLEIHATTDPAVIPLDDITGSTDSINDFTTTPWPDPKGPAPPPVPPPAPAVLPAAPFPPQPVPAPGPGPAFQPPFPPMGPGAPFMPPGPPMGPGADCWRAGDGKVVGMPEQMMMGPPQPMMGPPGMPMGPGPMMLPPGVSPEMGPFPMMGPNPAMPEEMAHFVGGFPGQMPGPFPPGPPVGPPQGPPQWQGQGGGQWYGDGGDQQQPHHNQSNGPSHRGSGGGGSWRGRGGRNRKYSDGGNWAAGNSRMPICNNFLKKGFCRNNSCRYRHPRN